MKTKYSVIAATIFLAVFLCMPSSSGGASESDTLVSLQKELQQSRAQIEQLVARTSALEQQVRVLEQSNAKLQQEVRSLQMQKPRVPTPKEPPLQEPHLTPLQTN